MKYKIVTLYGSILNYFILYLYRLYIQPPRKEYTTNISCIIILYVILHILYFNNYILSISTIHIILTRCKKLPEDDVLMSKHVGANHT